MKKEISLFNILTRIVIVLVITFAIILTSATFTNFVKASKQYNMPQQWKGQNCDTLHDPGSQPSGTFQGISACYGSPNKNPDVPENLGGTGLFEWECVELAMRYMLLTYGISPYPAPGGKDVAPNYKGSTLKIEPNPAINIAPAVGDIISFGPTNINASGHVAIVDHVDPSVASTGSGNIEIFEQNSFDQNKNALPFRTTSVSNWKILSPSGLGTITNWLHNPTPGHLSITSGITPVPSTNVVMGGSFSASYYIKNDGGQNITFTQLQLFVTGPNNVFYVLQFDGGNTLTPGSGGTISYSTQSFLSGCSGCSPGSYTLTAQWKDTNTWHTTDVNGGINNVQFTARPYFDNTHTKVAAVYNVHTGTEEAFTIGTDGNIWHTWSSIGTWGPFVPLNANGPFFTGNVTAIYVPSQQVEEVFARDINNNVYHNWLSPTIQWSGWQSLGCCIVSDLTPVIDGNGHVVIFGRGGGNGVYYKAQNPNSPGGWDTNWSALGGVIQGNIAAIEHSDGTLDVFIRGGDNNLYHTWQTSVGGSYNGWNVISAVITGDPSVILNDVGTPAVWVPSSSGQIWYSWQTGAGPGGSSQWSGWYNFTGRTAGSIPLVRHNDGSIEVVVTSTDGGGAVSHNWQIISQGGSFSGWYGLSITASTDPGIMLSSSGGTEAFIRGTDNILYHAWQTDGNSSSGGSNNWSSWQSLGATG